MQGGGSMPTEFPFILFDGGLALTVESSLPLTLHSFSVKGCYCFVCDGVGLTGSIQGKPRRP